MCLLSACAVCCKLRTSGDRFYEVSRVHLVNIVLFLFLSWQWNHASSNLECKCRIRVVEFENNYQKKAELVEWRNLWNLLYIACTYVKSAVIMKDLAAARLHYFADILHYRIVLFFSFKEQAGMTASALQWHNVRAMYNRSQEQKDRCRYFSCPENMLTSYHLYFFGVSWDASVHLQPKHDGRHQARDSD